MLEEMRLTKPVRVLRRAAFRAGRGLDDTGWRLRWFLRRQPQVVPLAALAASQLVGPLLARRHRRAAALATVAKRAGAIGALAVGALAVGALAIGAVSIGALAIARVKIKRLQIDVLEVRQAIGTPLTGAPVNS